MFVVAYDISVVSLDVGRRDRTASYLPPGESFAEEGAR